MVLKVFFRGGGAGSGYVPQGEMVPQTVWPDVEVAFVLLSLCIKFACIRVCVLSDSLISNGDVQVQL